MDLITLASIKDSAEATWWKCQNAQELKELTKTCAASRKPIQDLVSSVKTGVNELKKAVASFDQRSSHKRNSGASGTASRRKKLKASSPSLFDKGLEQGTQIPIFSTIDDMMKQVNMNRPAIVRLPSDLQSLMKGQTDSGWFSCGFGCTAYGTVFWGGFVWCLISKQ